MKEKSLEGAMVGEKPPEHLSKQTEEFWVWALYEYQLNRDELHLLLMACEAMDRAAAVGAAVDLVVVDQHRHTVPCQVKIGLEDLGAICEPALEGGQCVLGRLSCAAAVPDRQWRWRPRACPRAKEGMRHALTISSTRRCPCSRAMRSRPRSKAAES